MKRKILATFLSTLILVSVLFGVPMTASANTVTVRMMDIPSWRRTEVSRLWDNTHIDGGFWSIMYTPTAEPLYCLVPGRPILGGATLSNQNFIDGITNATLSDSRGNEIIQALIGRIFQYVDHATYGHPISETVTGFAQYIAAQLLIWEVVVGERNESFGRVAPPANRGRVRDTLGAKTTAQRNAIMYQYDRIVEGVRTHTVIPSFTAGALNISPTHTLTPDGSGGLTLTLTDTRGVLSRFQFSASQSGVTFTRSGNNLTIRSTAGFSGTINVNVDTIAQNRRGLVSYGGTTGPQPVVRRTAAIPDPVRAFMRLEAPMGSLRVVKAVEHWHTRAGFDFEVTRLSDNHRIGTFTSPVSGEIYIPNLVAGSYTVREIVPNGFVAPTPNPRTITVVAGRTGSQAASTTFNNIRQRGTITVTKLDRDTGTRAQGLYYKGQINLC